MSVFRVKLNNTQQGLLDLDPSTATPYSAMDYSDLGTQMDPSLQRTIFVAGPNRKYRELFDGTTFTDCNYWKRFAYPQVPLDQAFIEVVTDDGSIYSDYAAENNYPVIFGGDTAYTVLAADTFADNYIDIVGDYSSYATFVQIQNLGTAGTATQDVHVQLNDSDNSIFNLAAGDTQIFNNGDLLISKLAFEGQGTNTDLQIILSLSVNCQS